MKRILLLSVATLMAVCMMAMGDGSGNAKANAIEFDLRKGTGIGHGLDKSGQPQTLWYRVDLAPLYEEDNPSLSLYLTNPSRDKSVEVYMEAVVGQKETKRYTIGPHQYKSYTANASLLVRMQQTEIYLTLWSTDSITLSARVFETEDLDETCKDARTLKMGEWASQTAGYAAWWKIDLTKAKEAVKKDVKISITNDGDGVLDLVAGQSLDCPSSGLTKRNFTLAAHETIYDTIPQSMITSVLPNELYFSLENLAQPLSIKAELIDQPEEPVMSISAETPLEELHVMDTTDLKRSMTITKGKHLYYITKAEMNALNKYEPEFTYSNTLNNAGPKDAHIRVQMAFHLPAFGSSNTDYEIPAGKEEIEVYKKNMLDGLGSDVDTIYLQITTDVDLKFMSRYKHVREGKACKTNIDFGDLVEENKRTQEARTIQWYAVDIDAARFDTLDITGYLTNEGSSKATVTVKLAFSCPHIDLQEATVRLAAGDTIKRTFAYSTFAGMAKDSIWFGVETNQNIKFWATTSETPKKDPADVTCVIDEAKKFNWEEGDVLPANEERWYLVNMKEARNMAAKFPTVFVQNRADAPAKITAEMSLGCPDIYENDSRSLKLDAYGTYSKQISRNMFENIKADSIYIKVKSTQEIFFQMRLTEEQPGTLCTSAIPFNWTAGNDVAANSNQWVSVDLHDILKDPLKPSVRVTILNKDKKACSGTAWLAFACESNVSPDMQNVNFSLASNGTKSKRLPYSLIETANDSIVWVRVVANTTVHVSAELVYPSTPFEPIDCPIIESADTLDWNTVYTREAGTRWYLLPKRVLESLATLTTTPEIHVTDKSGNTNKITAEFAYVCPIESEMMKESRTLNANQTLTKLIERATIDQVIRKEQVYIRVTAQGAYEFQAKLINPNTGNDRNHAINLCLDSTYIQHGNTVMWYKLDTRAWKSNPDLYGKRLNIKAKNSDNKTEFQVWLYEDVSEENLIEKWLGNADEGKRKSPANEVRSRSIPASVIYGMSDTEFYFRVEMNHAMKFSLKLDDYETLPEPVNVKEVAKLAVPNVTYTIPANQDNWYVVCAPYMYNNYSLTDSTSIELTNKGTAPAHVRVIGTMQDVMTFKMPERSRTIEAGAHYIKSYKQLLNKAIKKAGFGYDIAQTSSSFIEEQVRKYTASPEDSLTGYFRICSDQPLEVRIFNVTPTTGQECVKAPMKFDWEHGNVNPAGQETYYLVNLESWRVPEHSAIRLHVENWSENENEATAELRYNCTDPLPIVDPIDYKLKGNQDKWKDINREVIGSIAGWSNIVIRYYSEETSRIWVEVVPEQPRDTVYGDTIILACVGDTIYDTFVTPNIPHFVDKAYNPDTLIWRDTVEFLNDTALAMWDSIFTYKVITRLNPEVIKVPGAQRPYVKRGEEIKFSDTSDWLIGQYRTARNDNDTIKDVDSILWEWSTGGGLFTPLQLGQKTSKEAVKLTYQIRTLCNDTLPGDTISYIARDTLDVEACEEYVWDAKPGSYYTASVLDSVEYLAMDSVAYLNLTINMPTYGDTTDVEACGSFIWYGVEYTVSSNPGEPYTHKLEKANIHGCDSIIRMNLTITAQKTNEVWETACESYDWNGKTYTQTGIYKDTLPAASGCDSIVTLNLTINHVTYGDTTDVEACGSFIWYGVEYTESSKPGEPYTHTLEKGNIHECDSIIRMNLTIYQPTYGDTTDVEACGSFTWYGVEYKQSSKPGEPYTHTLEKANIHGCDSIIRMNLTIKQPSSGEEWVTACESYEWHDVTYTQGGDYEAQLTNVAGCDSIATLHLTINLPVRKSISESACKSYDWAGKTYTETGTYEHNFEGEAANGCDSIVTLNLTIFSDYELGDTTFMTQCKSYTWDVNGKTYTKSGLYKDTTDSKTGMYCGTVRFLQLTINQPKEVEIEETSCGTYEWHGETFKPAATPYDTVVTYRTELESGCDSITILTLHMLPLIEPTVINEEACVSYTWDVTKETYLRDTIVSHTFQAGYCDSVVTLYLTIKQPIVGDTVADECNLFVWRDVTYITDTIVFDTIAGAASNGCDSIVRLSLKIGKPFVGELDLIDQYNGRLLMINRTQINKLLADSLDRDNDTTLVKWYRESSPEDEFLGVGYYYTNLDGSPIEAGVYYAVVEIPASNGAKCGAKGETQHYRLSGGKSAPALIPTLARPGQDVRVINLDPELYTTIRIYSTEGVLQNTYNVHGENTFTIKAANNHGFYLVELSGDSMNTTLRYIVK